jgi:hypothetical protein
MAVVTMPNPSVFSDKCPQLPGSGKAITASDADTFERPVHVYCGVAGNVVCTPENQQADVTVAVQAGGFVPFRVLAVKATGTTATGLVAVY